MRLVAKAATLEGRDHRQPGQEPPSRWQRGAIELRNVLLPSKILSGLANEREVVIVPHGPISLVPFTALPSGDGRQPLSEKLAIRYAPSLGTLGEAERRRGLPGGAARSMPLSGALIVGNPAMPEVEISPGTRDRLSPLPGAEAESRSIASMIGAAPLTGIAAT